MDQINSAILRQFEQKGLNINEGVAVNARLVKLASRPLCNKEIDELRKNRPHRKANSIKTVNPKNLTAIWIQT